MGEEENKAIVRRFVKEIFEELRADSVDELATDDFTWHAGDWTGDRAFLRTATERIGKTLTDIHFRIDDEIAEGDRVCVRLTAGATAIGEVQGIDAAGKGYSIEEIHIFRLAGGKVAEHWHQFDALGQRRQLAGDAAG